MSSVILEGHASVNVYFKNDVLVWSRNNEPAYTDPGAFHTDSSIVLKARFRVGVEGDSEFVDHDDYAAALVAFLARRSDGTSDNHVTMEITYYSESLGAVPTDPQDYAVRTLVLMTSEEHEQNKLGDMQALIVEFDLEPGKYEKATAEVVAEITLTIRKDWQHLVELWFKSAIGARFKNVLCDPQYTVIRFGDSGRPVDGDAAHAEYTGGAGFPAECQRYGTTDTAAMNRVDEALTRSLLYTIMTGAGYYSGDAHTDAVAAAAAPPPDDGDSGESPVAAPPITIKDAWTAILQAIVDAGQTATTHNLLTIGTGKVKADLRLPEPATVDSGSWNPQTHAPVNGDGVGEPVGTDVDGVSPADVFAVTGDGAAAQYNAAFITNVGTVWPDVLSYSPDTTDPLSGSHASSIDADRDHPTLRLSNLPNADAFRPVFNRWIRSGLFFLHAYTVDSDSDSLRTDRRHYVATDSRAVGVRVSIDSESATASTETATDDDGAVTTTVTFGDAADFDAVAGWIDSGCDVVVEGDRVGDFTYVTDKDAASQSFTLSRALATTDSVHPAPSTLVFANGRVQRLFNPGRDVLNTDRSGLVPRGADGTVDGDDPFVSYGTALTFPIQVLFAGMPGYTPAPDPADPDAELTDRFDYSEAEAQLNDATYRDDAGVANQKINGMRFNVNLRLMPVGDSFDQATTTDAEGTGSAGYLRDATVRFYTVGDAPVEIHAANAPVTTDANGVYQAKLPATEAAGMFKTVITGGTDVSTGAANDLVLAAVGAAATGAAAGTINALTTVAASIVEQKLAEAEAEAGTGAGDDLTLADAVAAAESDVKAAFGIDEGTSITEDVYQSGRPDISAIQIKVQTLVRAVANISTDGASQAAKENAMASIAAKVRSAVDEAAAGGGGGGDGGGGDGGDGGAAVSVVAVLDLGDASVMQTIATEFEVKEKARDATIEVSAAAKTVALANAATAVRLIEEAETPEDLRNIKKAAKDTVASATRVTRAVMKERADAVEADAQERGLTLRIYKAADPSAADSVALVPPTIGFVENNAIEVGVGGGGDAVQLSDGLTVRVGAAAVAGFLSPAHATASTAAGGGGAGLVVSVHHPTIADPTAPAPGRHRVRWSATDGATGMVGSAVVVLDVFEGTTKPPILSLASGRHEFEEVTADAGATLLVSDLAGAVTVDDTGTHEVFVKRVVFTPFDGGAAVETSSPDPATALSRSAPGTYALTYAARVRADHAADPGVTLGREVVVLPSALTIKPHPSDTAVLSRFYRSRRAIYAADPDPLTDNTGGGASTTVPQHRQLTVPGAYWESVGDPIATIRRGATWSIPPVFAAGDTDSLPRIETDVEVAGSLGATHTLTNVDFAGLGVGNIEVISATGGGLAEMADVQGYIRGTDLADTAPFGADASYDWSDKLVLWGHRGGHTKTMILRCTADADGNLVVEHVGRQHVANVYLDQDAIITRLNNGSMQGNIVDLQYTVLDLKMRVVRVGRGDVRYPTGSLVRVANADQGLPPGAGDIYILSPHTLRPDLYQEAHVAPGQAVKYDDPYLPTSPDGGDSATMFGGRALDAALAGAGVPGTYVLLYQVEDAAAQIAVAARAVEVVEVPAAMTDPEITLTAPGLADEDAGAVSVPYGTTVQAYNASTATTADDLGVASVSDADDATLGIDAVRVRLKHRAPSTGPDSREFTHGDFLAYPAWPLGKYVVTYTATDSHYNRDVDTQHMHVVPTLKAAPLAGPDRHVASVLDVDVRVDAPLRLTEVDLGALLLEGGDAHPVLNWTTSTTPSTALEVGVGGKLRYVGPRVDASVLHEVVVRGTHAASGVHTGDVTVVVTAAPAAGPVVSIAGGVPDAPVLFAAPSSDAELNALKAAGTAAVVSGLSVAAGVPAALAQPTFAWTAVAYVRGEDGAPVTTDPPAPFDFDVVQEPSADTLQVQFNGITAEGASASVTLANYAPTYNRIVLRVTATSDVTGLGSHVDVAVDLNRAPTAPVVDIPAENRIVRSSKPDDVTTRTAQLITDHVYDRTIPVVMPGVSLFDDVLGVTVAGGAPLHLFGGVTAGHSVYVPPTGGLNATGRFIVYNHVVDQHLYQCVVMEVSAAADPNNGGDNGFTLKGLGYDYLWTNEGPPPPPIAEWATDVVAPKGQIDLGNSPGSNGARVYDLGQLILDVTTQGTTIRLGTVSATDPDRVAGSEPPLDHTHYSIRNLQPDTIPLSIVAPAAGGGGAEIHYDPLAMPADAAATVSFRVEVRDGPAGAAATRTTLGATDVTVDVVAGGFLHPTEDQGADATVTLDQDPDPTRGPGGSAPFDPTSLVRTNTGRAAVVRASSPAFDLGRPGTYDVTFGMEGLSGAGDVTHAMSVVVRPLVVTAGLVLASPESEATQVRSKEQMLDALLTDRGGAAANWDEDWSVVAAGDSGLLYGANGELEFAAPPDYDADPALNSRTVTVRATVNGAPSESVQLTVNISNVAPLFDLGSASATDMVVADGVLEFALHASDPPDDTVLTYSIKSQVLTTDAGHVVPLGTNNDGLSPPFVLDGHTLKYTTDQTVRAALEAAVTSRRAVVVVEASDGTATAEHTLVITLIRQQASFDSALHSIEGIGSGPHPAHVSTSPGPPVTLRLRTTNDTGADIEIDVEVLATNVAAGATDPGLTVSLPGDTGAPRAALLTSALFVKASIPPGADTVDIGLATQHALDSPQTYVLTIVGFPAGMSRGDVYSTTVTVYPPRPIPTTRSGVDVGDHQRGAVLRPALLLQPQTGGDVDIVDPSDPTLGWVVHEQSPPGPLEFAAVTEVPASAVASPLPAVANADGGDGSVVPVTTMEAAFKVGDAGALANLGLDLMFDSDAAGGSSKVLIDGTPVEVTQPGAAAATPPGRMWDFTGGSLAASEGGPTMAAQLQVPATSVTSGGSTQAPEIEHDAVTGRGYVKLDSAHPRQYVTLPMNDGEGLLKQDRFTLAMRLRFDPSMHDREQLYLVGLDYSSRTGALLFMRGGKYIDGQDDHNSLSTFLRGPFAGLDTDPRNIRTSDSNRGPPLHTDSDITIVVQRRYGLPDRALIRVDDTGRLDEFEHDMGAKWSEPYDQSNASPPRPWSANIDIGHPPMRGGDYWSGRLYGVAVWTDADDEPDLMYAAAVVEHPSSWVHSYPSPVTAAIPLTLVSPGSDPTLDLGAGTSHTLRLVASGMSAGGYAGMRLRDDGAHFTGMLRIKDGVAAGTDFGGTTVEATLPNGRATGALTVAGTATNQPPTFFSGYLPGASTVGAPAAPGGAGAPHFTYGTAGATVAITGITLSDGDDDAAPPTLSVVSIGGTSVAPPACISAAHDGDQTLTLAYDGGVHLPGHGAMDVVVRASDPSSSTDLTVSGVVICDRTVAFAGAGGATQAVAQGTADLSDAGVRVMVNGTHDATEAWAYVGGSPPAGLFEGGSVPSPTTTGTVGKALGEYTLSYTDATSALAAPVSRTLRVVPAFSATVGAGVHVNENTVTIFGDLDRDLLAYPDDTAAVTWTAPNNNDDVVEVVSGAGGAQILRFKAAPNFEADAQPTHVTLRATATAAPGIYAETTVTVHVTDVNEAPAFPSGATYVPTAPFVSGVPGTYAIFTKAVDEDAGDVVTHVVPELDYVDVVTQAQSVPAQYWHSTYTGPVVSTQVSSANARYPLATLPTGSVNVPMLGDSCTLAMWINMYDVGNAIQSIYWLDIARGTDYDSRTQHYSHYSNAGGSANAIYGLGGPGAMHMGTLSPVAGKTDADANVQLAADDRWAFVALTVSLIEGADGSADQSRHRLYIAKSATAGGPLGDVELVAEDTIQSMSGGAALGSIKMDPNETYALFLGARHGNDTDWPAAGLYYAHFRAYEERALGVTELNDLMNSTRATDGATGAYLDEPDVDMSWYVNHAENKPAVGPAALTDVNDFLTTGARARTTAFDASSAFEVEDNPTDSAHELRLKYTGATDIPVGPFDVKVRATDDDPAAPLGADLTFNVIGMPDLAQHLESTYTSTDVSTDLSVDLGAALADVLPAGQPWAWSLVSGSAGISMTPAGVLTLSAAAAASEGTAGVRLVYGGAGTGAPEVRGPVVQVSLVLDGSLVYADTLANADYWVRDRGDVPPGSSWDATSTCNDWTFGTLSTAADQIPCVTVSNNFHVGNDGAVSGDSLLLGDFLVYARDITTVDVSIEADIIPGDDDTFGLVLCLDPVGRSYYKLAIDMQRGARMHILKVNGATTRASLGHQLGIGVLANTATNKGATRRYRFEKEGNALRAYIDGVEYLSVTDDQRPLMGGRCALANAACSVCTYSAVRIETTARGTPVPQAVDASSSPTQQGLWVKDRGDAPASAWGLGSRDTSSYWTWAVDDDGVAFVTTEVNGVLTGYYSGTDAAVSGGNILAGDFFVYHAISFDHSNVAIEASITPNDDDTFGLVLSLDRIARSYYKLACDLQRGARMHIIRVLGNTRTSLASVTGLTELANTTANKEATRRYRFERRHNRLLLAYIDGVEILRVTDPDPLGGGNCALMNAACAPCEYSRITIDAEPAANSLVATAATVIANSVHQSADIQFSSSYETPDGVVPGLYAPPTTSPATIARLYIDLSSTFFDVSWSTCVEHAAYRELVLMWIGVVRKHETPSFSGPGHMYRAIQYYPQSDWTPEPNRQMIFYDENNSAESGWQGLPTEGRTGIRRINNQLYIYNGTTEWFRGDLDADVETALYIHGRGLAGLVDFRIVEDR